MYANIYVCARHARTGPCPPKSLCPVEAMLIVFTPARPRIAPFFVADVVLARDKGLRSRLMLLRDLRRHVYRPIAGPFDLKPLFVFGFRHTHAALLLDSGATPKVVQRQLRHAAARTTLQIYGHVVGDAHRDAVEKVASIVDPNGPQSANRSKWIQ